MDFKNLVPQLREALSGLSKLGVLKTDATYDVAKEKKKSQKGAVHKHNPTFKSRNILSITGAKYRRLHMGAKQKGKKDGS